MAAVERLELTSGSGGQRAYEEIRARILRLEFAPGAELEEGALSRLLGLSRTPVREALIRLASEGLLVLTRGRGARVAPLEISSLRAFFEALDLLQRAVCRLAALRRTEPDLAAIEPHLHAFEESGQMVAILEMTEDNYRFHMAIAAAAHSDFLERAYSRVMTEGLRVARVCFSENYNREALPLAAHVDRTASDHRALYEALLQQDADAAERLAHEHIVLFQNRVSQTLTSLDGALDGLRVG